MAGKAGRPKVHGSAAERQAAHRKERDVRSIALGPLGKTIDEIARDLDRPVSEVVESLLRFALMNRNWRMTGLMPSKKNGDSHEIPG